MRGYHPRRMRTALLSLVLASLLVQSARAEAPTARVVETVHYRLEAEADEGTATEYGRVLEAAYEGLAEFFGQAPKLADGERLRVRFFDTQASWAAGMRADGVEPPTGAGGYYAPGKRTAYLYRQPTRTFTRVLLVHEATHQFHYLARTRNAQPSAKWYREGVAEFLSWHTWDGTRIRLGVRPRITLSDYAAKALAAVTEDAFDLGAVVDDRTWPGYAPVWALFRYLATGRDGAPLKGFETFCRKMDAGGGVGPLFKRFFKGAQRFRAGFVAWLEAEQQPWTWMFNEWEDRGGDAFRGFAGVVSACRLKQATDRLTARLEVPPEGPWCGGLLLHYGGADDYTVALLDHRGRLRVDRRVDGAWKHLATGEVVPAPAGTPLRLAARRAAQGIALDVGEATFGPFDLPASPLGLAVDSSDLVFSEVEWQLTGAPARGR